MKAGAAEEPSMERVGREVDTSKGPSAPTVDQRKLGAHLRLLREQIGLTVYEAAERLVCPPSQIQEIEAGVRRPTSEDLRNLTAQLKVDDPTADELADLARKARQPGWWAKYEDLGVPYIGFEEEASVITAYGTHYFPALLQTRNYAQAIITAIAPKIDPKILEQRVEARLRRQHVLGRGDLHYQVLLDESVLQRPVGGSLVMREQLERVLAVTQNTRTTVQIMPLSATAYIVQDSNFVLLDFAAPEPLPIVFVEGLAASHYHELEDDVDRYREAIGYLLGSALSPQDSIERINQARHNYENS